MQFLMGGAAGSSAPPGMPGCEAAKTTEGLANQVHTMLTSPFGICFPNPIDTALGEHKKKFPFIESKSALVILESDAGGTPEMFLEKVLNKLKHKDTIKNMHLYPSGGWSPEDRPFDFAKFSEHLAEHLPKCEFLHVRHMLVKNFRIESITIKSLMLVDPQPQNEEWEIKCPNLKELDMQNHTPPVANFQRFLMNSPRLETYMCHKYWHEEPLPELYLPNCTKFTFRRGDITDSLKLYLPKVKELNLDACYDLDVVELLTEGHADHAEWNAAPGSTLSKFNISLRGALLSARAFKSLRETGRVNNPNALRQAEEMFPPP